jgi:hypothetical protein
MENAATASAAVGGRKLALFPRQKQKGQRNRGEVLLQDFFSAPLRQHSQFFHTLSFA